ncbi:MAG: ABC transporter ATP-binding protein [Verrucomicrobia bacterium]|nr:ABC transporter ATP-binding protein [Verrucomicrobiota bacterium]
MATPGATEAPAKVPAVEIRGLVKDFAIGLRGVKLRAVDHLDLTVEAGQVFGLLGPNGSGKSTTVKLLLGLLEPTAGQCRVFGVSSLRVEARREVGYLPEAPYFYRHLSGRELVHFYARLCGESGTGLGKRIADVIALVGLAEAADRRVGTYSKGMLQRIGLAQALVHDPRLLILDEPTAGVDPVGSAEMAALIGRLKAQGKTILITSHLLGQIEDICDRVAILDRGRLMVEGAVADLVNRAGRQSLVVEEMPPGELAALRAWMEARGRKLLAVEPAGRRLEQVFLEQVGRGKGEGETRP